MSATWNFGKAELAKMVFERGPLGYPIVDQPVGLESGNRFLESGRRANLKATA